MVKTIITTKTGPLTLDDVTDFELEQGALILQRHNGQSWKVCAAGQWYEADINVVAGELTK